MLKKARYFFEFLTVLMAGVLIRILNPKQTYNFGAWLGRVVYRLGVARSVALENLAQAFPEKSEEERGQIARGAYEHFTITVLELLRMPLIDPRQLLIDFEFDGLEVLEESLRRGKGAVCLSGHFGNWEWMGAALVARGYPLSFMIGTQSNPWVDHLFNSYRTHCNINLIPLKNVRAVLSTLKRNQFVALLGDQDGDRWGVFVNFFGRVASTFSGPAVFAQKTGSDILFAVPVRLGPQKHRVKILKLAEPPEGLSEERQIAFRLQAYNDALEQMIRQYPEQWLWMHKRWEAKPEHHLAGEQRAMAERGEIYYDTREQVWRRQGSQELFPAQWLA